MDRRPHPGFWDHRQRLCTVETLYLFLSLKCLRRGRVRNIWSRNSLTVVTARVFCVVSGFFYFHPQCQGRMHLRFYVICEPRSNNETPAPNWDGLPTVQITFIFIGQTHLVFGKRVCTCVTKHSNVFRTFLNWLKNSKRVWHVVYKVVYKLFPFLEKATNCHTGKLQKHCHNVEG